MVRPLFLTLFMARSGSKFLRSLLNQHPDAHDFGEFFHDREKRFPTDAALFEGLGEVLLSPCPVRGIQFRYPRHFTEIPEFVQILDRHPASVRVLLLKRRNTLKGAISQQNAEALKRVTGKTHLFRASDLQKVEKLRLDIPRALKECRDRERLDNQYRAWASARFEALDVYYEDLLRDRESVVKGICSFLGLNPFKPGSLRESELVKVTSDDLSEAIENYDDLARALNAEGLDHFLLADEALAESLAGSVPALPVSPAAQVHRASDRFEYRATARSGMQVELVAEILPVRAHTMFLEDVFHPGTARRIISIQDDVIHESADDGQSWARHPVARPARKWFTTRAGWHLLQDRSGTIDLYDETWTLLERIETGAHAWHGSWSVDQAGETGTIIWAEYPYCAEAVKVWRSVDGGRSWSFCFVAEGHETDPKQGDIRHFHVVQACSSAPGRWYLSSGDHLSQCRFWISQDDGRTWQEVPLRSVTGPGARDLPEALLPLVHRFTALIQTDDRLVRATDETFQQRGARVCVMDKGDPGNVRVFEGTCGANEIRNLIRIDARHALAVSEAKLDREAATISLIDLEAERVEVTIPIPNLRGTKRNFMNGISSRRADRTGLFFARSDNIVLYPAPMTTRWRINLETP
ncbi:sulfotransferase family protein [Sinisalibacter lacisalsi]|uniref:Sulfotransferase domain-containing protein n=1 Tax=Sinisalibacter lacisalsi TaxID=1526570 RepID=A0ABQ1QQA4_9RHOB|nr:sulfotransferase [Sinisalibacter lacisalsi]GGD35989.1 hypothetical protein GCM10011358_19740 [Sinisalibacter lacisalsi]